MQLDSKAQKILLVVGTRPEVIKMAPVYYELKSRENLSVSVCSSGQHSELLLRALLDFGILPEHRLELISQDRSLASLTSKVIEGLNEILDRAQPDFVLVHGDTTTALAASLCAYYRKVPIGHVEAGLRTGSIYSPFPEEFNRQAITRIATLNFAPTPQSQENLLKEGASPSSIILTGNTIVDAIERILIKFEQEDSDEFSSQLKSVVGFEPRERRYVVITVHRRETIEGGLEFILQAVSDLAEEFPGVNFVLPLHPNPKVRSAASRVLPDSPNVMVIDPLGYREFIYLLGHCDFVLTDSGGIQEEAVTLGVNVLIARSSTERPEGISSGLMRIVGIEKDDIVNSCRAQLLLGSRTDHQIAIVSQIYGNGSASKQICDAVVRNLKKLGEDFKKA